MSISVAISYVNPSVAANKSVAKTRLTATLEIFMKCKIITGAQADQIAGEFKQIISAKIVKEWFELLTEVKHDYFWRDLI